MFADRRLKATCDAFEAIAKCLLGPIARHFARQKRREGNGSLSVPLLGRPSVLVASLSCSGTHNSSGRARGFERSRAKQASRGKRMSFKSVSDPKPSLADVRFLAVAEVESAPGFAYIDARHNRCL